MTENAEKPKVEMVNIERSIVFDSGPIISLTTNNLLWILEPLKKQFNGEFLITAAVKKELIDKPLAIKRFKFEGLQVLQLINSGVLKVVEDDILNSRTDAMLELANKIFKAKDEWLNLVHYAEMQALAAAKFYNSQLFVVDERTTRFLIEDPRALRKVMEHRLKTPVAINEVNLNAFLDKTKEIKLIRSVELVAVAYRLGLLDKYLISDRSLGKAREQLLDSIIWGLKLRGCSISEKEIQEIVRQET
ncbi:MAG: hypothetical protein Q8O89_05680 [Nanoarchaeota archaeon]|nr:hypothetical protein [Nanoarchaeota archaeon]